MIIILWAVDIVVVILMMTRVDGAGKLDEEKLEGCWVEDKKSVKKFGNRFSIYFF